MATHSSILAWELAWTEEPGRVQSLGIANSPMTQRLDNNHLGKNNTSKSNSTTYKLSNLGKLFTFTEHLLSYLEDGANDIITILTLQNSSVNGENLGKILSIIGNH